MSAVAAIHFDPVFGMGSRQPYSSWAVIESSQHSLLGPDLSSSYVSDTSVSPPPTSRSITNSPPRYNLALTPQQLELKRQRDHARRHDKALSRRSTASTTITSASASPRQPSLSSASTSVIGSPSYLQQQTSSPAPAMADLGASSATGSLPGTYTTSAPSQMSLMSESAATTSAGLNSPSYMATGGGYSPSMHDHAANQGVFSASGYQSQSYMPEYTTSSFPSAAPSTLQSQYPRTAMPDQPNMVYHMPPPHSSMMGAGHMHQQPQHQQQQQAPSHHSSLPHPMAQQHRPQHHAGHHQGSPPLAPTHAHTNAHAHAHAHTHAHAAAHHHHQHPYDGVVGSAVGVPGSAGVRVVQSRPKPQCWEHGCNGRQFSTFSNLLRHQREKSGQAAKAVCPNCGAEFTRTTARNGHLQHDKCKQRRSN